MILLSLLAGFLSTMNVWAVIPGDVRIHLNDVYMILLMFAWMMFLNNLYYCTNYKMIFLTGLMIIGVLYLIRNQIFISDQQFIKGMIPHHSMAVLMATNIEKKTHDERIRKLAQSIIKSQGAEISYLKSLEK